MNSNKKDIELNSKVKRTIKDFFTIDSNNKKTNNDKCVAKRTKLDVEEVFVIKEIKKCSKEVIKEVNISESESTQESTNSSKTCKSFKSPKQVLREVFGFNSFRSSLQENAIKCVIEGQSDVFISMPTGAGKSLCYQLPAIYKTNKVTVVVSPLIALITNQISALKKLGINAETINSHLAPNLQKKIRTELMSEKVGIKLVYITPEMAATPNFGQIIEHLYKSDQLNGIAIDEAHCVSQWGHDFRPDYLKLIRLKQRYPNIVWMALTATASEKVVEDIISLLGLRKPVQQFVCPNFRKNLFYDIVFKDLLKNPIDDLKEFVLNEIGPKDLPAPKTSKFTTANLMIRTPIESNTNVGIIYCRTRAVCEEIAHSLSGFGIKANAYHAGMTAHQRKECQEKWMSGIIKCIIATVSFGMGVDKGNVRFVVHWNLPQSLTGYYQESGRAGRDGQPSKCRIYYSIEDRNAISFLIKQESEKKLAQSSSQRSGQMDEQESHQSLIRFEQMVKYCENGHKCRHSLLLSEFVGDDIVVKTGCKSSCDVCTQPKCVERSLQLFQSFQMNKNLKTYRSCAKDDDRDDWSLPKFDEPQHTIKSEERVKEISTMDIIRQEFNRRNKAHTNHNNAHDLRQMGFRSATDVMEPANQKIKDLNLTLRQQFVEKIIQEINKNVTQTKQIELSLQQMTKIAAQFELSAYKLKNSKMTYRAVIADYLRNLKRATDDKQIHESILKFNASEN